MEEVLMQMLLQEQQKVTTVLIRRRPILIFLSYAYADCYTGNFNMMTRALDCFGYCIQVDYYIYVLELRLEKVTNSVLMICKFYLQIFWGAGQQREGSDVNGWGSARTRRRNMIPWMCKSGLAVMVYA